MKIQFLLLMVLASPALSAQHHETTNASSATLFSHFILQQTLADPGLENREVKMLIVDYPPGSKSTAHRHPCPTFGYVLEGEIESTFEEETHLYKKGDSFYEFSNGLHSSSRNPHASVSARLLVFFIAEKDKPTTIPEK